MSSEIDLRPYLSDFTDEELKAVEGLLSSSKGIDLSKLSSDLYRCHCPTPEEFLQDWIHPDIRDGLFPYVKQTFIDIWDYESNYSEVILYGATRGGKSVISRLCIVYCIVIIWCLKDPHQFFGINKMSAMCIYLMSFSKIKAQGLLLKPITNILKSSPKFHQVMFEEQVEPTQKKLGTEKIVWTTADKLGAVGIYGDLHIVLGASPLDIIGSDIVMALITEINFFIESIGVDEETVWRVFTDTKDRILATIGRKYGAMVILDSSANNKDSLIESYILEDAPKVPNVYYLHMTRWEARPELFPEWKKTGKTFPVFTGTTNRSPAIVTESFHKQTGDEKYIQEVPIDALEMYQKNIRKSLADISGIPSGGTNLFFSDWDVFESMWDDNVNNVTSPIEAPLVKNSAHLIFEQIKDVMFRKNISGKYFLYRAPKAPRWIHIDTSEASDRTGMAICHPEIRNDGNIVCVYDLAADIRPSKNGINFDAVLSFVQELYREFHVMLVGSSTDRWQSSFFKQGMMKDNIPYFLVSVDRDKSPYFIFKTKILNSLIKVGRYENIANNLRSLIEYPDRIDHSLGKNKRGTESDKEVGRHSKDISDAMSGACASMFRDINKYSIEYNYDDINRNFDMKKAYLQNTDADLTDFEKDHLYKNLVGFIKQKQNPQLKKGGLHV